MTNISWSKKCVFFPAGLFISVSQDKPVTKIIKTFQVAEFDNILDHLEMVQTIWKVSRQFGKFLLQKRINVYIAKTIYVFAATVFSHFVRKVFAW